MGKHKRNISRCRHLLPPSCSSSWLEHTADHSSVGHLGASARTAKGASATRTTQEEVVEEASLLRTVEGPNATKTTLLVVLVVLVDSNCHPPTSTTRFKTAKDASATRTTQEEDLEDLEDFHSGNS